MSDDHVRSSADVRYPWPYNGDLRPDNTALIVIDMQTDFCGTAAMSTRWATTSR